MTLKYLSAGLIVVLLTISALWYAYELWLHRNDSKKDPRLATWICFFLGSGTSFLTYAIATEKDFLSGILNLSDFVATSVILLAAFLWGNRLVRFRPFETWFALGTLSVLSYGIFVAAWSANLFAQVLIALGYIPTLHNIITSKRNTEPYVPWILTLSATLISFYPAIVNGNMLALIYTARAALFSGIILAVMTYYEIASKESIKTNHRNATRFGGR